MFVHSTPRRGYSTSVRWRGNAASFLEGMHAYIKTHFHLKYSACVSQRNHLHTAVPHDIITSAKGAGVHLPQAHMHSLTRRKQGVVPARGKLLPEILYGI